MHLSQPSRHNKLVVTYVTAVQYMCSAVLYTCRHERSTHEHNLGFNQLVLASTRTAAKYAVPASQLVSSQGRSLSWQLRCSTTEAWQICQDNSAQEVQGPIASVSIHNTLCVGSCCYNQRSPLFETPHACHTAQQQHAGHCSCDLPCACTSSKPIQSTTVKHNSRFCAGNGSNEAVSCVQQHGFVAVCCATAQSMVHARQELHFVFIGILDRLSIIISGLTHYCVCCSLLSLHLLCSAVHSVRTALIQQQWKQSCTWCWTTTRALLVTCTLCARHWHHMLWTSPTW